MTINHQTPGSMQLLVLLIPILLLGLSGAAPAVRAAPASEGPSLGVMVRDTPFSRLEALGLGHGVTVGAVVEGSPADQAGIARGDILVSLDGLPIYSSARLQWLVSQQSHGKTLSLRVHRAGSAAGEGSDVEVVLEPIAPAGGSPAAGDENGQAWLGVRMQPMTEALRTAYGVPQGQGVLITDVVADSPAAGAGLRAGDVITRIDRRAVRSTRDVRRGVDFFDPGETVPIVVIRNSEQKELPVTLGRIERALGGFRHDPLHPLARVRSPGLGRCRPVGGIGSTNPRLPRGDCHPRTGHQAARSCPRPRRGAASHSRARHWKGTGAGHRALAHR